MAAGQGTRMKSDLAKVMHPLRGKPMIHYVIDTAKTINGDPIVVIVGHQKERVMQELAASRVRFAVQEPQLGTGHAVMCGLQQLQEQTGPVLILSGDVPLIRHQTLSELWHHHRQSHAAATVLTAMAENPHSYGRIVRSSTGNLEAIVEQRDASEEIRKLREINSGIYIFELDELRRVLPLLSDQNDQKEYYLTDAVRLLTLGGKTVAAREGSFQEVLGINTVQELQAAELL
ncbi:MAG: NTP transferase domain-containing protein [bacterium]|nr:NTP transferase domain-containing protein [bacterium]